ncbi:MAG: type II secretion system protein [Phycisphaerae bacterium]|nr:type II secretion system protein [Phycisphaerae bacterium]
MRRAFTLMELIVSLGILALVLSFAGVIFRVSIGSQQLAQANAEIMQKLRTLTDQLDADFRGLCKDGEIFVVWEAHRKPDPNDYLGFYRNHSSMAFERFDRIMFFASGDFQTYGPDPNRGNVARICYTLAQDPTLNASKPNPPESQEPHRRILARTQHILIPPAPGDADEQLDVNDFDTDDWIAWNSRGQVDRISLEAWKRIPFSEKANILSVIGDVDVGEGRNVVSTTAKAARGALIDRSDPDSLHAVFCQGVGQFMVQGWNDAQKRWIPDVNPETEGETDPNSLADSDFPLEAGDIDPNDGPGLWYPRGGTSLTDPNFPTQWIDKDHFNQIPGLGRALKFTFTLYDSRNLIKHGRTFTHIVYLDN